jgi:ABC-type branched-subunit amino acid transport system ATPase component
LPASASAAGWIILAPGSPLKIIKVAIGQWRNFSGIELLVPPEIGLVCLIGENGTGKSNLLELLSAVSHEFGLTPGTEPRRGNPLEETHEGLEVHLHITDDPQAMLGTELWESLRGFNVDGWDGSLIFRSDRRADGSGTRSIGVGGEGFEADGGSALAGRIAQWLREFSEVRHVYLDADRAYPPRPIQVQELAEALQESANVPNSQEEIAQRAQWAFRSTRTLYDRWARDLVASEQREGMRLMQLERDAIARGEERPAFSDQFESYRAALQRVLPHLRFHGVVGNALAFDSAGDQLRFEDLSGGEREIAFLVGQIDRFRLTRGLMLLDEPELHLNPDLLRAWLEFIVDGISDGQVWIATHAMEAVEVAGAEATFVVERDGTSRTVSKAAKLEERGAVAILSRAVGSPAFSLQNISFVYIEGDQAGTGEKERFYELCGEPASHRFMPAGGSKEVVRSVESLRNLAVETGETLTIGGVVDRDFKSSTQIDEIREKTSVLVLNCHEIENLFLFPPALDQIDSSVGAEDKIREAADSMAGLWIMRRAYARGDFRGAYIPASRAIRSAAGGANWTMIDQDPASTASGWSQLQSDLTDDERDELKTSLADAIDAYRAVRESEELWKSCMGKEVLKQIPTSYGFTRSNTLERAIRQAWASGEAQTPDELAELREYVQGLAPVSADEGP